MLDWFLWLYSIWQRATFRRRRRLLGPCLISLSPETPHKSYISFNAVCSFHLLSVFSIYYTHCGLFFSISLIHCGLFSFPFPSITFSFSFPSSAHRPPHTPLPSLLFPSIFTVPFRLLLVLRLLFFGRNALWIQSFFQSNLSSFTTYYTCTCTIKYVCLLLSCTSTMYNEVNSVLSSTVEFGTEYSELSCNQLHYRSLIVRYVQKAPAICSYEHGTASK